MKVKDLQGKEHQLDVRGNMHPVKSEAACRSKIQFDCGQLLIQKFPFDQVLEEINIPGLNLYLDFFIPKRKIAVEIHGRQHDEYIAYFHKSHKDFKQSLNRDSLKKKWCEINGIELYTVRSVEEMKTLLGIKDEASGLGN